MRGVQKTIKINASPTNNNGVVDVNRTRKEIVDSEINHNKYSNAANVSNLEIINNRRTIMTCIA